MERRYKDSGIEWIGNLPETWEISSIKHLMQLYAGATPKSDNNELWDGDISMRSVWTAKGFSSPISG